jgi:hypothetical protein
MRRDAGTDAGMTQTQQSYDGWVGRTAYDANGEKIGEITDIFYDDKTRRPEWVAIKTGLFKGTAFAPIQGSSLRDGDGDGDGCLQLAYDKAKIADAQLLSVSDDHMTPEEEADVWAYYGYDYGADTSARNTDFGYGQSYTQPRADKDFMHRRWNEQQKDWTDERKLEEHTEEVPVATTATVEVPVEAKVRLRRYNTTQQKTRTVEIPYEETTEHTEVASVDAHAAGGPKVTGQASVGKTTR